MAAASEDSDPFVSFFTSLEKAGYSAHKLSVWVLQGVAYSAGRTGDQTGRGRTSHGVRAPQGQGDEGQGGAPPQPGELLELERTTSMVRSLLAEVGNAAAFNSLVLGELPPLTRMVGTLRGWCATGTSWARC